MNLKYMFVFVVLIAQQILLVSASESLAFTQDEVTFTEEEVIAHEDFQRLLSALQDELSRPDLLLSQHSGESKSGSVDGGSNLGAFSYSNCAKPDDEIVVPSGVSLKPDPLKIPGNVTGGGSVLIKSPFGSPVKLSLDIHIKKFGTWIKVPCVSGVGSCSYSDFCKMVNPKTCPPAFVKVGMPCKCPFKAGNWTISGLTLNIKEKIPFSGALRVTANASFNNKLLTCAAIQIQLK